MMVNAILKTKRQGRTIENQGCGRSFSPWPGRVFRDGQGVMGRYCTDVESERPVLYMQGSFAVK